MYRQTLRPARNLFKRYGGGWAVITGATNGIGQAYAFELARQGFNIFIVARNEELAQATA